MRKIALISEHASPLTHLGGVDSGGQNLYVAHVARQLARRGYTVDVFTRRNSSLQPAVFNWLNNVRVINVPAGPAHVLPKEELLPWMGEFGAFVTGFMGRSRRPYDLIHANFFMSGVAGLHCADRLGLPLVMTFHALGRVRRAHQREADRFPVERDAIEERLLHEADRTVAECPADRLDMLSLYGADPRRIDLVPCGVDLDELSAVPRAQARTELGWSPDEFVVLQLGRLVPRKGIDNVIRGVGAARRRHGLKARLVVVGGNSEEPSAVATPEIGRLAQIAEREGIADRVEFVGRRARDVLGLYYSAANVFVTTPWYEPFGITPLEAMACGTPVIGSRVGGIQYTVVDGVTGFLVEPCDADALADRLQQLADDPARARAMGEAGRRRVGTAFTWGHVARNLARVYERALAPRRAPQTVVRAPFGAEASQ